MRRFTDAPSLNRPRKDYADFRDYVALDGGCGTFDITESVGVKPDGDENVWYGRKSSREWEALYRTIAGRWVLVIVLPPGHENDAGPVNRELTPVQAARWLRLNELDRPVGLEPASLNDEAERRVGQAAPRSRLGAATCRHPPRRECRGDTASPGAWRPDG